MDDYGDQDGDHEDLWWWQWLSWSHRNNADDEDNQENDGGTLGHAAVAAKMQLMLLRHRCRRICWTGDGHQCDKEDIGDDEEPLKIIRQCLNLWAFYATASNELQ